MRSRTTSRLLVATAAVLAAGAATVYFAFPELLLRLALAGARRSAGLERHTVDAAGRHMAYLQGGNGPVVVLLHGFGANKDLWDSVAAHLTPRFRVIAPDLPGFGESDFRPDESYDAESQARRVRDFLQVLGVGDFHLAGSSMGGLIASVYAAAYPANVRSLLVSAAPGVRSPEKSDLVRRLEAGSNPMLVDSKADLDTLFDLVFFRPPSFPRPIRRAMFNDASRRRDSYARIFADLIRPGDGALEPALPKIAARTLVLWGAHDRLVHPACADVFATLIPHAEKTVFADCGHALPRECPSELADRYLAFLGN